MRYDLTIRYLARLWLDMAPMSPADPMVHEIRALTGRSDLLLGIGTDGSGAQRPALASPSGLQILLPGESFDVALVPVVRQGQEVPMMTFNEFALLATGILSAVARRFPERRGRRLAFVQEGLLNTSTRTMEDLPRRLFHLPEPFRTHVPFEWDWRLAARLDRTFGGAREALNTIVTVKRATGSVLHGGALVSPFDKVRMDLDISTSHEQMTPRFEAGQVEAFFTTGMEWHQELWRQLEADLQIEGDG